MKITLGRAVVLLAVVAGLLLVPLPTRGRLSVALVDLVHGPVFAILAGAVHLGWRRWLPRRSLGAGLVTWVGVASFGAAMELVQGYTGRGPSLHDALANALGAAGGILWAESSRLALAGQLSATGRTAARLVAAGLVLAAELEPLPTLFDAAQQQMAMPLVASFEHAWELRRWSGQHAQLARQSSRATDGQWSLHVELEPARFSSVAMHWPPHDWTGYDELVLDVWLEGDEPLEMVLKIFDDDYWATPAQREDRFEQRLHLLPGWQQVRVSLAEVEAAPQGRRMNLTAITFVELFAIDLPAPRALELDNVRLQ